MPSNLAGGLNLGQYSACLLRVASLDTDCSPLQGNSSGHVTTGIVTATPTPDYEEGTTLEPKDGCGRIAYTVEEADRLKRVNLTGELIFHDFEFMQLAFGGTLVLGAAGGSFPGQVIGHALPNSSDDPNNGVYLEIITKISAEGAGDCITSGSGFPTHVGHIFGKAKMSHGEMTLENDVARLPFTAKCTANPNLFDGPWNDYPGSTTIPNSPWVKVGYTTAEYTAILAMAAAGYDDLPTAS